MRKAESSDGVFAHALRAGALVGLQSFDREDCSLQARVALAHLGEQFLVGLVVVDVEGNAERELRIEDDGLN
jgi:hypothetical protein